MWACTSLEWFLSPAFFFIYQLGESTRSMKRGILQFFVRPYLSRLTSIVVWDIKSNALLLFMRSYVAFDAFRLLTRVSPKNRIFSVIMKNVIVIWTLYWLPLRIPDHNSKTSIPHRLLIHRSLSLSLCLSALSPSPFIFSLQSPVQSTPPALHTVSHLLQKIPCLSHFFLLSRTVWQARVYRGRTIAWPLLPYAVQNVSITVAIDDRVIRMGAIAN